MGVWYAALFFGLFPLKAECEKCHWSTRGSKVWWLIPVITAFRRMKQEPTSSGLAWATQEIPNYISKTKPQLPKGKKNPTKRNIFVSRKTSTLDIFKDVNLKKWSIEKHIILKLPECMCTRGCGNQGPTLGVSSCLPSVWLRQDLSFLCALHTSTTCELLSNSVHSSCLPLAMLRCRS